MRRGRHTRPVAAAGALVAAAALVTACAGRGGGTIIEGANVSRGHDLIEHFGCGTCHTISGVEGANGRVGPDLRDFARQRYIVGILRRTPQNTARWIQDPQKYSPGSVMPDLGVGPTQARDIAAYLYGQ